ncbi:MAG TPA: CBS domain-containing protein, partial [Alphaproteobacteria bacterium]|nr:CBS domain-containing protein [Alphaproteobacteria bacterium]
IAILRDGKLVQYGTPDEILTRPADAFVEDFVGADRALKRLSLVGVKDAMSALVGVGGGPAVSPDTTLRDALSLMLAKGARHARVVDGDGMERGQLSLDAILARIGDGEGSY